MEENSKKLAVITGADGGMGMEITLAVAKAGYHVIMACKDTEHGESCRTSLLEASGNPMIEVQELDLASFDSVRKFAAKTAAIGKPIHLLANNAGILCWNKTRTEEGFETSMGVNYLGHFLLTRCLMDSIEPGARIVNTISCTYKIGKIHEEPFYREHDTFWRIPFYSDSKLALALFTIRLAGLLKGKGITVNASDPGIVSTNIIRQGNIIIDKLADWFFRPFIYSPKKGASTAIHLLLDEEVREITGGVFSNCRQRTIPERILNHPKAEWLWNESMKLTATT